jgi:hypothetical protein
MPALTPEELDTVIEQLNEWGFYRTLDRQRYDANGDWTNYRGYIGNVGVQIGIKVAQDEEQIGYPAQPLWLRYYNSDRPVQRFDTWDELRAALVAELLTGCPQDTDQ